MSVMTSIHFRARLILYTHWHTWGSQGANALGCHTGGWQNNFPCPRLCSPHHCATPGTSLLFLRISFFGGGVRPPEQLRKAQMVSAITVNLDPFTAALRAAHGLSSSSSRGCLKAKKCKFCFLAKKNHNLNDF